ncbi:MAG TPA: transposase [Thermoanaerobaculia bacterium]|nr:transposase [Thermoanaerobaculia bacterium]
MARPLRLEFPGGLYHVSSRGILRHDIVRDDSDREAFVQLLGECVARFEWILISYVLMSNHFHLVVQLTSDTLSRGLQWLNGTYAIRFNRRHDRAGCLLQSRPDVRLVDKETYLLTVLRYDALNPVRAGMVRRPGDYKWSSYRAVVGQAVAPDWLALDDVLAQFGPERSLARAAFRQFVEAAIGSTESPWDDLARQIYLGSETWIETIRQRVELKPRSSAHPKLQRFIPAIRIGEVIQAVAETFGTDEARIRLGRGGRARMAAAWVGACEGHLSSTEIAAGLHLRWSGRVTQLVDRCQREMERDGALRDKLDRAVSTIRGKYQIQDLTPGLA